MSNIKSKDIIVYSIAGLVGILMIWVLFGTDLIMDNSSGVGSDPNDRIEGGKVSSNFNNFNSSVKKKIAADTSDKIVLAEETMAERIRQEEEKERDLYEKQMAANQKKVSDVATYLESGGKDLDKERSVGTSTTPKFVEPKKLAPPVQKKNSSLPRFPESSKEVSNSKMVNEKKGRVRSTDPTFEIEGEPEKVLSKKTKVAEMTESAMTKAVIDGSQTIKNFSRVIIRLTESIEINGCVIPQNTEVNCKSLFDDQRVLLNIVSLKCDGVDYAKSLKIYDAFDGQEGLYVQLSTDDKEIKKDVAKDAISEGATRLGVPFIGRNVNNASRKKIETPTITLDNQKLLIENNFVK